MSAAKVDHVKSKPLAKVLKFTLLKVNVIAGLIALITVIFLISLVNQEERIVASLTKGHAIEADILAAEQHINRYNLRHYADSPTATASFNNLKLPLSVAHQNLRLFFETELGVSEAGRILDEDTFLAISRNLGNGPSERKAVDVLNLVHTLVKSPPNIAARYDISGLTLLPLMTFIQDRESANFNELQGLYSRFYHTLIVGVIALSSWYFVAWLIYKRHTRSGRHKFSKSKLRVTPINDDSEMQNKAFLQLISHEFRAPISAIISALELIPNMESKRSHLIQQAEQSSYRLLNLTNNLTEVLATKADDNLQLTKIDLISLLDECISPFSVQVKDKKIEFNMHCSHSVPQYVNTDPIAISKVITNILDNAVKFTTNGLIDVAITTQVKKREIFLVVVISDTGIGIDEVTQKRMFERFYRGEHANVRRYPGAGIGLSIANKCIAKLGGDIEVSSTVGVGSEFKISIPLNPVEIKPPAVETPSNAKFAVVDDLEISRLHLQAIITSEGFTARTFSSGANLLSLHDEILQFSGIIVDLYMPGMNGLELVRTLRAIYRERVPPIIVLSATPDIANIIATSELPVYQGFVKPIDRNRFVDALRHLTTNSKNAVPNEKKARILVVEDEPINAELVEYMLQCMGHEVTVSYTGDDAISRANETAFDCVLLDINLPDISGLEVAKILKEGRPDLPIIALTANAHRDDKEASLRSGIRYHLVKPITFQELKNTLRLAL
ncbi:hypothetical protein MTsDn5_32920 [Alteromonas gracilis]|uniref:response regulator n=1 Tax=Alteromonas gracilis TaxID=1479524 RepID=UPI0036F3D43C